MIYDKSVANILRHAQFDPQNDDDLTCSQLWFLTR